MTTRVEIHPASIKHMKKGHPWVTKDRFSIAFPKSKKFLCAKLDEGQFAILINDPQHREIKARMWRLSNKSRIDEGEFKEELTERINKAFEYRSGLQLDRENYYLCFGEADELPGLFIQKLGDNLLIQNYSHFWNTFERILLDVIKVHFPNETIWVQRRNKDQKREFACLTNKRLKEAELTISEFEVKYKILLNSFYDTGIYTDMSAIRSKVTETYVDKDVLNLYSYTGAYSLYALSQGAKSATSVDLSDKYLTWLDENLALNPQLDREKHTSLCLSVEKALDKFIRNEQQFDLIICDPPSASSDGKKMSKAIDSYKNLVPKLEKCLRPNGEAVLFLNTHSITRRKFEDKVKSYITNPKNIKIKKTLKLNLDCPSLKGFPEGDYLKGLVLLKKK